MSLLWVLTVTLAVSAPEPVMSTGAAMAILVAGLAIVALCVVGISRFLAAGEREARLACDRAMAQAMRDAI